LLRVWKLEGVTMVGVVVEVVCLQDHILKADMGSTGSELTRTIQGQD
jgi:hypothetical protein